MTDSFDRQLAQAAMNQETPSVDNEALRNRVLEEYEKASRKVLWTNTIAHCALGFALALIVTLMAHSKSTMAMIALSTASIITCMGLVVMKLWYWVVITKLDIMEEIKLLRLQKDNDSLSISPDFRSAVAMKALQGSGLSKLLFLLIIVCTFLGYVAGSYIGPLN